MSNDGQYDRPRQIRGDPDREYRKLACSMPPPKDQEQNDMAEKSGRPVKEIKISKVHLRIFDQTAIWDIIVIACSLAEIQDCENQLNNIWGGRFWIGTRHDP